MGYDYYSLAPLKACEVLPQHCARCSLWKLLRHMYRQPLSLADQGLLDWAENMGISILAYDHLYEFLTEHTAKKPVS